MTGISQFSNYFRYALTKKNLEITFRTAAEWLLRNGACAKFVGSPHLHCDYNLLPPENSKFFVKEIQAGENAGINADGFAHIKGCEKLDRIALNNCSYITDEALEKLALRKDTLKVLEITDCKNITDEGLRYLKDLSNLEKLILRDLPYVKNPEKITSELKAKLVNCDIDFK